MKRFFKRLARELLAFPLGICILFEIIVEWGSEELLKGTAFIGNKICDLMDRLEDPPP